jgi:hypothetical protein
VAEVIRAEASGMVRLNEVCEDDLTALGQALVGVNSGTVVLSGFRLARSAAGSASTCGRPSNGSNGGPIRSRQSRYALRIASGWVGYPTPGVLFSWQRHHVVSRANHPFDIDNAFSFAGLCVAPLDCW